MASGSSKGNLDAFVDDVYFSVLSYGLNDAGEAEDEDVFPLCDERYAAELQLQEVIMSSAIAATSARSRPRTATGSSKLPIVIIDKCSSGASSSSSSRPTRARTDADAALVFCKICMDAVPTSNAHRASSGCAHAFCTSCLTGYIGAKIQERISDVRCPEERCIGVLDPALCQAILPREVFERWGAALCESMMLGANRTYCPFKDCSAMMVVDVADAGNITESECPTCRRLFCAQCSVPWHAGTDCAAYKKLGKGNKGKDDLMLLEMARGKKWKRCPKCKYFVEKSAGCLHITCRCGFEFCYGCGMRWGVTHASCSTA